VATAFVAALALGHGIHLAVRRLDVVGHHAELAHVRRIGVEIQSGVANRICNDSAVFALRWHAALKDRAAVGRLLLAHLGILVCLLDPIVSRGAEVNKTLLVLLNEGLVVRHGHF
jgi:hypothetical protein